MGRHARVPHAKPGGGSLEDPPPVSEVDDEADVLCAANWRLGVREDNRPRRLGCAAAASMGSLSSERLLRRQGRPRQQFHNLENGVIGQSAADLAIHVGRDHVIDGNPPGNRYDAVERCGPDLLPREPARATARYLLGP